MLRQRLNYYIYYVQYMYKQFSYKEIHIHIFQIKTNQIILYKFILPRKIVILLLMNIYIRIFNIILTLFLIIFQYMSVKVCCYFYVCLFSHTFSSLLNTQNLRTVIIFQFFLYFASQSHFLKKIYTLVKTHLWHSMQPL